MLAGCSAASSLPGLGTTTTVPTTQPPTFAELAATGEAYEVRLRTVGAAPLRRLVTAHPIGAVATYEVAVIDGDSRIDGVITVEVLASAADGSNERLRVELVAVDAAGIPEAEAAPAVGASVTMERDGSRVVIGVERVVPAGLTRRADLAAHALLDAVGLGAVPLPAPAVGDGATWDVRWSTVDAGVVETSATVSVEATTGVATVTHPVDADRTGPGGVRSTWRLDGGGPFGSGAELVLGSTTILLTRV